jgi:hypothetical protein
MVLLAVPAWYSLAVTAVGNSLTVPNSSHVSACIVKPLGACLAFSWLPVCGRLQTFLMVFSLQHL